MIRMEYGQSGEQDFQDLVHHKGGASSQAVSIDDIDNATAAQYNNMQKGKKQAKQKNVARRRFAFTKEEDAVLCSAYLNIKTKRLNMKPDWFTKKMGAIHKAVSTFSAYKSKVDRRNESGKNEYDRIEDAVKMYEEKKLFQFMHCWKILLYEAKWNDKLLEVNSTPSIRKVPAASKPIITQVANDPLVEQATNDPIERPEGRDNAKGRRANEDSAFSNGAVEVLQQIHQNNELIEMKQDAKMQEILNLKGTK